MADGDLGVRERRYGSVRYGVEAALREVKPFGGWKSPITTDLIVAESLHFGSVRPEGDLIYWLEGRPRESGRNVVVACGADGTPADVTPGGFNARSRAHEYGGGEYTVHGGSIWFVNFPDQRLYVQHPGEAPVPLTPPGAFRCADMVMDPTRKRLVCVREDHSRPSEEPVNAVVAVDAATGDTRILAAGSAFYSTPRMSRDAKRLAWLSWDHPQMPWDGTELWVAELGVEGGLETPRRVAGGCDESVFQPEWSAEGYLYFAADATGWWNLYRWRGAEVQPLCPMEAEFGVPQWQFGMSTYAPMEHDALVCTYGVRGVWHLGVLDPGTGTLQAVCTPYTQFDSVHAAGGRAVCVAGTPDRAPAVVAIDLATGEVTVLRHASARPIDAGYLSPAEAIEFPTSHGEVAHGLYYAPRNPDFRAPPGERPPLLVRSHGGPTAATSASFNLGIQFWTSRGFAVLDVNYRGSSGYGRAYRTRLWGAWGSLDVDDCVYGARHLAETDRADPARLAIRGSSAGGYTTLAALTFSDVFKAGASYYGISDLEALARDTHKFEARYLDRLVGPLPQERARYRARSPIHFTDRLSCPVIFFQGLEDKVVPPSQAQTMVAALRAKGIPVAYVTFPDEQHGFRKAENIKRALDAELTFYARVFGFDPADGLAPLPIDNLD